MPDTINITSGLSSARTAEVIFVIGRVSVSSIQLNSGSIHFPSFGIVHTVHALDSAVFVDISDYFKKPY
ncbi:MAG: hypothetical protein OER82_10370 [Nitrosopumilus sp.]|nr:hypothetical protein [Nitrosopumilus sp.]MDH3766196.1 hypothetical protein [Nitrosopumilus sp.]